MKKILLIVLLLLWVPIVCSAEVYKIDKYLYVDVPSGYTVTRGNNHITLWSNDHTYNIQLYEKDISDKINQKRIRFYGMSDTHGILEKCIVIDNQLYTIMQMGKFIYTILLEIEPTAIQNRVEKDYDYIRADILSRNIDFLTKKLLE